MEINGLQIMAVAFSVFMAYFAYVGYKRKHFALTGFFVWIIIFLGVIGAALFPGIFLPFARLLKIARVFDLFAVAGFFFLITVTFINFLYINRLKKTIGKLIQSKALEDFEKMKKGGNN